MRRVCVIGGSRYFGKRLVDRLVESGVEVTVVNRGTAPAGAGARHVVADRNDEAALRTALGGDGFDVVVDQVCYTPVQAAIAARVFAGRTDRYVMTSTIEVYAALGRETGGVRLPETAVDLDPATVDMNAPWHDLAHRERHYGEAKRQAEAVLAGASFPFTAVRVAHVLGGGHEDFTKRLEHYVDRVRSARPIDVFAKNHPSTFIHVDETARFLDWAARQTFTGPVNANSRGELTVAELCEGIPGDKPPRYRTVTADASPFAFGTYYAMDNSRATALGFGFSHLGDWLPGAVAELETERTNTHALSPTRFGGGRRGRVRRDAVVD